MGACTERIALKVSRYGFYYPKRLAKNTVDFTYDLRGTIISLAINSLVRLSLGMVTLSRLRLFATRDTRRLPACESQSTL